MTTAPVALYTTAGDFITAKTSSVVTTLACAPPTNVADNDLLVAVVAQQTPQTSPGKITENSGTWTLASKQIVLGDGKRPSGIWILPVPHKSALATSYTWTCATGGRMVMFIFRVTGADLTNPLDSFSDWDTNDTANNHTSAPISAFTTVNANALVIVHAHSVNTSAQKRPAWNALTGFTKMIDLNIAADDTVSNDNVTAWFKNQATAGTTGSITPSVTLGQSALRANAIAIKPYGVTLSTTPELTLYNGTTEEGLHVTIYDGTVEQEISAPRVYAGPQTITSLMTGDLPYSAHRGGSANWPEETLFAYKQSHNRGVRALEISLWKTSDGSFACSHDQSTLRTTGTDLDITTQTRATLAAMTVNPVSTDNQSQSGQPFAFLDQVMALYGTGGPVLFIEDKQGTNWAALLDYLDTFPDPTNRFMIKMYGPGGATAKALVRSRGYKIWSYYFAGTDMNSIIVGGVVGGNIASCDYVGLDFNLTDSDFSLVVAYGKPVFAHILTTTTQRDRVRSLGAIGAMVANVKGVIPGAASI